MQNAAPGNPTGHSDDLAFDEAAQAPGAFRRTLLRVMTVQVVSLLLLWLLQSWFA